MRPRKNGVYDSNYWWMLIDVLKAMFREAVPTYLMASPLVGLKRLRVVKNRKRVLAPDEEVRLLAKLRPADQALYIVAVDTLMRLSNVLNLKCANIQRGAVWLEDSKTGPYAIPLSPRAQAALKALPKTKSE